jgi:hypothetical protein
MIYVIGIIAYIFFIFSIGGSISLHYKKDHDRAFKEEICGIAYLYLVYLCFR